MILFKINNVDFTARVNQRSYSVQKQPVYTTWTDGDWINHREIARTQISGSFNMTFVTEQQYEDFLAAIAAVQTTGGYCPVQLWDNTSKALATIDAFIDISTKHVWTTEAFGSLPVVAGVTVKVTQR